MNDRKKMGKNLPDVILPVAPSTSEMPESYREFIHSLKQSIREQRLAVVIRANVAMTCLYWKIGHSILEKQLEEGWGARVIDRISKDLQDAFPEMKGFSARNLKYMRKFAENWPDFEFVQRVVAQIPWRSNILLLEKVKEPEIRTLYVQKCFEYGWSSTILSLQIDNHSIERMGKSVNNFSISLPPTESDMANHIFKDPYLFDFLGTDIPRREFELEAKLTEHIRDFLLELGQGFAFVGRQVHLEVGGDDFYIDLLFYHLVLRCYVVVELKACKFDPGFISQLNMYQNIVNEVLRHPDDKPTIGLLLVREKNKTVVEYSLAGYQNPIGVADWNEKLTNELPDALKSSLPTVEEIERELES